jgi:hypothetical protein
LDISTICPFLNKFVATKNLGFNLHYGAVLTTRFFKFFIDVRECIGPYIFPRESSSIQIAGKNIDQLLPIPLPKIQKQNKVPANESCEQFYTPVRGCETCRICNDRDFCNDLLVKKEEANNAFGNWMGMNPMMLLLVYMGNVVLTASKMMEN